MKNLKVWLVFLPLLSISCSDDYTNEINESASVVDYMEKPTEASQIIPTDAPAVEYSVTEAEEDRRKDKDWEISVTKIAPKKSQSKESLVSETETDELAEANKINNPND